MKTFLRIDYKIQIFGFIILLFAFSVYSIITKEFFVFIRVFVWISILQLVSMLIKLMLNYKKEVFFYVYLLFSVLFWIYVLYEKSKFKFSYSIEAIWILLSFYSGFIYYFLSIFYLLYSYKTSKHLS